MGRSDDVSNFSYQQLAGGAFRIMGENAILRNCSRDWR